MEHIDYVSRRVMDRYHIRMDRRIERLHIRISRLEQELKKYRDSDASQNRLK